MIRFSSTAVPSTPVLFITLFLEGHFTAVFPHWLSPIPQLELDSLSFPLRNYARWNLPKYLSCPLQKVPISLPFQRFSKLVVPIPVRLKHNVGFETSRRIQCNAVGATYVVGREKDINNACDRCLLFVRFGEACTSLALRGKTRNRFLRLPTAATATLIIQQEASVAATFIMNEVYDLAINRVSYFLSMHSTLCLLLLDTLLWRQL